MSCSSLSRYSSAKPPVPIDRRSPPLPFTASTRAGRPDTGSVRSNFELVLPPPKFVIRRSAPNRFERYRSNSSGRSASPAAIFSSQRSSSKPDAATVLDTHDLPILLKPAVVRGPAIARRGIESLDRKGLFDDRPRLGERAHRAGREQLHRDVAERGGFHRPGQ